MRCYRRWKKDYRIPTTRRGQRPHNRHTPQIGYTRFRFLLPASDWKTRPGGWPFGCDWGWPYASLTCAHAGPRFHLEVHMDFLAHWDLDVRPGTAMSMT